MLGLNYDTTGLMEVSAPPTLCPNHEAAVDAFSPSKRSPSPYLLNIDVYMKFKEKLVGLNSLFVPG